MKALISKCDELIKEGQPNQVGALLADLVETRIEREWRLPLAKICRRAGLFHLGLRILSKVILLENQLQELEASASEQAEYAVLLQRSGALTEALKRLEGLKPNEAPEALLYKSFVLFEMWEFEAALEPLREYLKFPLSEYELGVGEMNLAFALVESHHYEEALSLLNGLSRLKSVQAQSNRHSLLGQVHLQNEDWSRARQELEMASGLVSQGGTNDQMFAIKWKLILDGLETRDASCFEKLKKIARRQNSWEACREADFFSLKVEFKTERFLHLNFGSPYAGFRKQLCREFPQVVDRKTYVLGPKKSPRIDIAQGTLDGEKILSPGQKSHLILDSLWLDFYRPLKLATLFSLVLPDEHFDIYTSPHRMHQLISRTRKLLNSKDIPLVINEKDGFYSLRFTAPFSVRIPLHRNPVDQDQFRLNDLKNYLQNLPRFTAKQVEHRLGLSQPTVSRLIQKAVYGGFVEDIGAQGRTRHYRIKAAA